MNSPVWPVLIPLLGSLLALLWPRRAAAVGLAASGATLVSIVWLALEVARSGALELIPGGWAAGLGIPLRADALSLSLMLMGALVAFGSGVYATGYFSEQRTQARFWPLWLLLLTALNALFVSGDIFNLYVTLELLSLSAVALATLGGARRALQAAVRYLMVGLAGSMMFLAGVALLYGAYATLDIEALATAVQPGPALWLALALMSAGLLMKCALFPLHFWLPPAHANAPAPVSAALSALVVKAAFYLILRLWMDMFQPAVTPAAAWLLGICGAGAVLWGSWQAFRAARLKLLAAYSTVAQLGYLFLFFPLLAAVQPGAARDTLFGALVLLALTHGFAKSALFLSAGVIQQKAGHDRIDELGGTARSLPVTTFTLALAGVALIGLPPSGTFLAKWHLMSAGFATGQWLWVLVVAAGSLLAAAYVFRVLGKAFGPGDGVAHALAWGREELPALLLALLATLVLGLGAAQVWWFVAPGAFVTEVGL